ncbi:MAG: ribonucleoside-diphosphate reductase, adenosylcobalamin-dependent, partial [Halohasta sp.]
PEEIANELNGIRSPKVAWDKGEQINSIPDAIGTALRRYLDGEIEEPYPKQQNLSELSDEPAAHETDGGAVSDDTTANGATPGPSTESTETTDATDKLLAEGESPECPECGSMSLYFSEGCKTCESCGWSEC